MPQTLTASDRNKSNQRWRAEIVFMCGNPVTVASTEGSAMRAQYEPETRPEKSTQQTACYHLENGVPGKHHTRPTDTRRCHARQRNMPELERPKQYHRKSRERCMQ